MEYLITFIIFFIVFGFIGMAIGDLGGKKNGTKGFVLGGLLGPIGCVIAAVIPPASEDSPLDKALAGTPDVQAKMAKLEAELAALKSGKADPVPSGKSLLAKSAVKPVDDDGEIPTYRLD